MSNKNEIYEMLEEEHLDFMIKLACKRRSAEEIERLMEEISGEPTEEDMRISEAAYTRYLEKLAAQEKAEKRKKRLSRIHRNLPRFIQAAACIVLAVGIAAPIAVAASPAVRAMVMEMLVTLGEDHTNVKLTEEENCTSVHVPEGWAGDYFPSYIPEGYTFLKFGPNHCSVVYQNTSGANISFREQKHGSNSNINDEESRVSYTEINGFEALVVEYEDYTSIVWSNGEKYFSLYAQLSKQELIKIAKSVRLI